jgi:hypothetical protein
MQPAMIKQPSARPNARPRTQQRTPLTGSAILLSLAALLSACASVSTADKLSGLTDCPEQRPQICTREYNPVCGHLADASTQTYATGCTACADPTVIGWVAGECPSPD